MSPYLLPIGLLGIMETLLSLAIQKLGRLWRSVTPTTYGDEPGLSLHPTAVNVGLLFTILRSQLMLTPLQDVSLVSPSPLLCN